VAGVDTAIASPAAGPPDAAWCLYASVWQNRWTVRLTLTFATTAPFAVTVVTPYATALTPETVGRIARHATVEVRFPPATSRFSFDCTH
jgi:hypothetical protein